MESPSGAAERPTIELQGSRTTVEVNAATLREAGIASQTVYNAFQKGTKSGLVMYRRDVEPAIGPWGSGGVMDCFWINPSLREALEFVVSEQSGGWDTLNSPKRFWVCLFSRGCPALSILVLERVGSSSLSSPPFQTVPPSQQTTKFPPTLSIHCTSRVSIRMIRTKYCTLTVIHSHATLPHVPAAPLPRNSLLPTHARLPILQAPDRSSLFHFRRSLFTCRQPLAIRRCSY